LQAIAHKAWATKRKNWLTNQARIARGMKRIGRPPLPKQLPLPQVSTDLLAQVSADQQGTAA
jgi:hypothetical protein